MSRIAVIGEPSRVVGFALAGAEVCPADGPEAVRAAWTGLAADVAVVVLTPAASDALGDAPAGRRLTGVMPV
jgi:vacuolar-type H+-ATPase subunit F/Vma7